MQYDFDYIVVGSGFGGSVAALRLREKGYSVIVLEKGKWFRPDDFPESNWKVHRWFWQPLLRFFGFFKLTFFRHITVLSGVGVGGGSLVYANTLPIPKQEYFQAESWSHLADWENELREHYQTALKMLGTTPNPRLETGDLALKQMAVECDKAALFQPTSVAVFFGQPGEKVPDPYFNGKGPDRSGCNFCGGCMVGCRFDAKNTLDKNYLYLAAELGTEIHAESEVRDIEPLGVSDGADGYQVSWVRSTAIFKKKQTATCRGIVLAGGVLGTIPLLLKLKRRSLPLLSDKIGHRIRTNSESLQCVTALDKDTVFSDGIAIGSIFHPDPHSALEPVRYPSGSGFWRLLMSPLITGDRFLIRIGRIFRDLVRHPILNLRAYSVPDWARRTQIMLYMQTINSTLRFRSGLFGMASLMEEGKAPTALMPEARALTERFAEIVNGRPRAFLTESLFGIPTTAHILGGAVMGKDRSEGVIDRDHRVFGYKNFYICDGSSISANPGVNPSLSIMALAERAMMKIPERSNI
jgi:cholesterol oxidase